MLGIRPNPDRSIRTRPSRNQLLHPIHSQVLRALGECSLSHTLLRWTFLSLYYVFIHYSKDKKKQSSLHTLECDMNRKLNRTCPVQPRGMHLHTCVRHLPTYIFQLHMENTEIINEKQGLAQRKELVLFFYCKARKKMSSQDPSVSVHHVAVGKCVVHPL